MKKIVIAVLGAAVLALGAGWFYINVLSDPEEKLTIDSRSGTTVPGETSTADDGTTDGVWKVSSQSVVGYRVPEILQPVGETEAVGRTNEIEGSITIAGTQATAGTFTVQVASISSDRAQRDGQFRGRIMDTGEFPTATFKLTKPIDFGSVEMDKEITATATGDLTMHGETKSVTFEVTAKRSTGEIAVNGAIPIHFADYNIDNPSAGPAQVGDDGTLEFTLVFTR